MKTPANIPEAFFHFIWENRLFYTRGLKTTSGQPLEIMDTGKKNSHAGPDFFNAKVRIGDTVWAGNVEIHKKASDWKKHRHSDDKAYENVILHVVEKSDCSIYRNDGSKIPGLEITFPEHYRKNFQKLIEAKTWIPCQQQFHHVDPVVLRLGFHRLMIERLEHKTAEIERLLETTRNDWSEAFYQLLARMFGLKVNALPFELLAKALPLHILAKHKNSLFQLEALLFGTSGLLHEELLGDHYFLNLREEFAFLYKKYHLKPVEAHLWKFLRLRPGNFPTIRISQLAALIHHSEGLFSKMMETADLESLKTLFRVKASEYWDTHYRFNKPSARKQTKELGKSAIETLIINTVIPFLFVYGEKQNRHHLKDRALDFLEKLPPENNAITRKWESLGVKARSAFETQALIGLKNSFCDQKKCLNCQIGNKLVKTIPDTTHGPTAK